MCSYNKSKSLLSVQDIFLHVSLQMLLRVLLRKSIELSCTQLLLFPDCGFLDIIVLVHHSGFFSGETTGFSEEKIDENEVGDQQTEVDKVVCVSMSMNHSEEMRALTFPLYGSERDWVG